MANITKQKKLAFILRHKTRGEEQFCFVRPFLWYTFKAMFNRLSRLNTIVQLLLVLLTNLLIKVSVLFEFSRAQDDILHVFVLSDNQSKKHNLYSDNPFFIGEAAISSTFFQLFCQLTNCLDNKLFLSYYTRRQKHAIQGFLPMHWYMLHMQHVKTRTVVYFIMCIELSTWM